MGGRRSGHRWRLNAKSSTRAYRALDVRRLARAGALRPGYQGPWQWTVARGTATSLWLYAEEDRLVLLSGPDEGLSTRPGEEPAVALEWTRCHFGGQRAWFVCPVPDCRRRVAVVYVASALACRHCHRLAYESTRETAQERAWRRLDRLRARLGWEPGAIRGHGEKPKWMHWRTFERLVEDYDQLLTTAMHGTDARLGGITGTRLG